MVAPRPEPVEIHARAMDNLRYIRRTIERAGSFTAVPGLGGVLMGSTALAAAFIAGPRAGGSPPVTEVPGRVGVVMGSTALAAAFIARPRTADARWLTVWLVEAVAALLIGIL